jgi:hypothetical protein
MLTHQKVSPTFKTGIVTTHSGIEIDLRNLDISKVTVYDIAHTLSHICRWNGIPEDYFSVAEHSVMVAERLPKKDRLGGLMHDSEEFLVGDNITPLKDVIPELRLLGNRIRDLLLIKYGVPYNEEAIKAADRAQLEWERDNIIDNELYVGLPPKKARALFVDKFIEYSSYLKL